MQLVLRARTLAGAAALAALALPGCVLGVGARPSRDAVRRGPALVERATAGSTLAGANQPVVTRSSGRDVPPDGADPSETHWMEGHVHWAGVDYVTLPGRWERRDPAYAWRPRSPEVAAQSRPR